MSNKHTPGPWVAHKAEDLHGYDHFVMAPDGFLGYLPKDSEGGGIQLFSKADARLIAAAPELLEALTKAVEETEHFLFEAWLVRVCPSGDVEALQRQWLASSDYCEFIDEWREQIDAIAKATGEA